jgi:NB-ARC domain
VSWWARRRPSTSGQPTPAVPVAPAGSAGPAAVGGGSGSITAAGDISGIASTGDWSTNVQYNAEHATVGGVGNAVGPGARSTVTLIDSQITLAMPTRGPVVPAQMPADTPLFTGRATIRSDIEAAIAQAHIDAPNALIIVALSGKGGVGKTALAVHLAHAVRPNYPDGQLYVDLRGAGTDPADPGEVLASFLAALGYERSTPEDLDDRRSLYLSALSDRRVLVLLDNAADEAQVRLLLPGSAGCLALVTSRRWLAALNTAVVFSLEILDPPGAVDLLGKLAGGDRVAREPEAAAEIARLCGYLPLAVCIAGGRLAARRHWSVTGPFEPASISAIRACTPTSSGCSACSALSTRQTSRPGSRPHCST